MILEQQLKFVFTAFCTYAGFLIAYHLIDPVVHFSNVTDSTYNLTIYSLFVAICYLRLKSSIRLSKIVVVFSGVIVCIFLWFLFDLTEEISYFDRIPLIGHDAPYRNLIDNMLLISIFLSFLYGVFLSVVEINSYRRKLLDESYKLRELERELREQSSFNQAIIQHAAEGLCVCHEIPEFPYIQFTVWNDRMVEITGYTIEEINRLGWYETMYPDPAVRERAIARMRHIREGDNLSSEEWRITHKNGHFRTVNISTTILETSQDQAHIMALMSDMTERKQLEKQLSQAQKLEALGTLAGGIAHDFNTILTVILGYSEVVLTGLPPDSQTWKYQTEVIKASNRAKELVQQILSFSKNFEQDLKPIDIVPIIKEAIKLLRFSIPSHIEFREDFRVARGVVLTNPIQIHQIVMNLGTNSYHAMRGRPGVLSITVKQETIAKRKQNSPVSIQPGDYLVIQLHDTGHGIDPTVMSKIFEPFFTTKKIGEGTGLGLSVVHGIVNSIGGYIHVDSQVGQGTSFQIFLPQIVERPTDSARKSDVIPRGQERIMIVDDEKTIISIEKRILEDLGYTVTGVDNSETALDLFSDQPGCFDLIVTDLQMPKLSGLEMVARMREIRPDIPIILCSGYMDNLSDPDNVMATIQACVTKPITRVELATVVRTVLDQA